MKIAIVYDLAYPFFVGGLEVRNYEVANRLAEKGHEVHVYSVKLWKGPGIIKRKGVYYHGYASGYKNFNGQRKIRDVLKLPIPLFFALIKENYDIVECSNFPYFSFFSCKLYSWFKSVPLVTSWQQYYDDWWFYYFKGLKSWFAFVIEKIVRFLSNINTVGSKKTYDDLLKFGKKSLLIENGVTLEKIKKAKASKDKLDLIYVGRLTKTKNLGLLIKAVGILKGKYPNIGVAIIGDGEDRERLEKLREKLGLAENITFFGVTDEKQKLGLLKYGKVFVFPSLLEGFGLVIIEAFAAGLPVIGVKSKWNASSYLIEQGKTGFVVKNNASELADAIDELLSSERLRKQLSKNAKKEAEKYSWDKNVEKLERYFLELCNRA